MSGIRVERETALPSVLEKETAFSHRKRGVLRVLFVKAVPFFKAGGCFFAAFSRGRHTGTVL